MELKRIKISQSPALFFFSSRACLLPCKCPKLQEKNAYIIAFNKSSQPFCSPAQIQMEMKIERETQNLIMFIL